MLRIGSKSAPPMPPMEEEMPQLPPEAPLPEEVQPSMSMQIAKVPQALVIYKTSDLGPFICSNCDYFEDDGSCVLVDGKIDPEGVCNLFMPTGPAEQAPIPEEKLPMESEVPPIEEPPA